MNQRFDAISVPNIKISRHSAIVCLISRQCMEKGGFIDSCGTLRLYNNE